MPPKLPLLRSSLLRTLLHQAPLSNTPFSSSPNLPSLSNYTLPSPTKTFPFSPNPFFFFSRTFTSSPSSSNIVLIGSEEEFNTALNKVQDEKLPAIFYFTAVWCGPCKFISPIIEEMSKKFPHVTTYKIDIDLKGLGSTLSKLKIYSVDGKKATEVVGADVARLKDTMENLYQ